MPKSVGSYHSLAYSRDGDEQQEEDDNEYLAASQEMRTPTSPGARRNGSSRASDLDLRSRLPSRLNLDEYSSLLGNADSRPTYGRSLPATAPASPRLRFSRQQSYNATSRRNHSRHGSLGLRVARAFGTDPNAVDGEYRLRLWLSQC